MLRASLPQAYLCSVRPRFCASARHPVIAPSRKRSAIEKQAFGAMAIGTALQHMQGESCVYLDYNATTPIFPECKAAVQQAREQVADMVHAEPEEIFFTSSGTESDHWAIWGARACKRRAIAANEIPHIIISVIEHPAVLQYLEALQNESLICYTVVEVNCEGLVSPASIQAAVTDATCLISIMHSNNEVGSIQPMAEIARFAKQRGILLHSDAAQSIGKVQVDVRELGVDMLTIVGHKFGAPKGVAALFIRQGTQVDNFFHGGGQEAGRRAGTENVLGIVGLGAAAAIVTEEQEATAKHMAALRDQLQDRLLHSFPQGIAKVNGPSNPEQRLPNTLSISIKGLRASELLTSLRDKLAASAGAACHSSHQATVSSVLQAMQVPVEYAIGTLRLSTGRHTTLDDILTAKHLIVARASQQGVPAQQSH